MINRIDNAKGLFLFHLQPADFAVKTIFRCNFNQDLPVPGILKSLWLLIHREKAK